MAYEIITIRCLDDNYAFVVANTRTGEAALIDAPEAAPINAALAARPDITLTTLLLTHHHHDHVEGIDGLDRLADLTITGAAADAHRLPALDQMVSPGEQITICDTPFHIMAADGHTLNHIAFYAPALDAVFTGDSLMTHGCGRLFEGTAAQMCDTMQGFAALRDETRTYCGHDYARANLTFAALFAPEPQALATRLAELDQLDATQTSTTGVTIGLEKQLNPYLRAHLPQVKASLDLPQTTPTVDVFAEIRTRKDKF
jgi:hydroxyacylglutathione hydrolase